MKDYIKMQIAVKSKFPQQLLSMPSLDIHFEQLWFRVSCQDISTSRHLQVCGQHAEVIVPYTCPSKEALLWKWNAAITHPPHPLVKIHFTSTLLSMAPQYPH